MAEFYKMNPAKWDNGTAGLTLEQEAAYLRIVNAINKADEPCPAVPRVLAGMFRCRPDKAMRLLEALVGAGKVWIEDGKIYNEHAMNDVEMRRELSVKRACSGHSGGIKSGVARSKPLTEKDQAEANASPREEKRREEKNTPPPPKGESAKDDFETWWVEYPRKVAKGAARGAYGKAVKAVGADILLSGVKRFAARVAGKEAQFIPHASTWLNDERWGDADASPSDGVGHVTLETRVNRARDWLSRNDSIPTWMDNLDVASALVKEGMDYERLRRAGFSLPPRGNVVNIGPVSRATA